MHRCWEIAELVHLVFNELDPYIPGIYYVTHPRRMNAIALSRLAQTCRRFSDPALDVLWRVNEGLIPILRCLPSRAWEIREGRFIVVSPLDLEDWTRCLDHSKRVEIFSYRDDPIIVDSSALESMISLPPGTLLPNVTALSCLSSGALFSYLTLLLGPHVDNVSVFLDGPTFRSSALLSFASHFRCLEHVHIGAPPTQQQIALKCVPSFITQIAPRTLDVLGLNHQAYRHISSLSNLVTLTIGNIIAMPFPGPSRPSPETAFPALRELQLTVSIPYFAINFLSVFHDAPLTTLCLSTTEDSTAENVFALLPAISDACAICHLETLRIFLCEDKDLVFDDPSSYTLTFEFIRHLLVYRNLHHLSVACPVGVELHDISMETIGRALPRLKILYIMGDLSPLVVPESHPTLSSLVTLSQLCSQLHKVWLAVDTISVPLVPCDSGRKTSALTWYPLDSVLHRAADVAKFLSANLPGLHIRSPNQVWREVGDLLVARVETAREQQQALF
ncbi:hypothetical protein R3P38DRAFT_3091179 [Favolaschia claudopus]|uniref:F-box domain-containing protein n=1 Tax=Favolaschia claudopus TaxID=2862362 RepID=A0AAV9ZTY6_9AGAR